MPTLPTITLSAARAQRLAKSVGKRLGLGRNATMDEVRRDVIDYWRAMVLGDESQEKVAQLTDDPFDAD
jgi:hypothetical protein